MSSFATSHTNRSGQVAEKQSRGQNARSRDRRPPTHFLAFPLISPHSLQQLSHSVQHFQETTTAPRPLRPSEIRALERQRSEQTPERDEQSTEDKNISGTSQKNTTRFNIIHEKAHRPVGTLHLTLGTMTFEDDEAIRTALAVLKGEAFRGVLTRWSQETAAKVASIGDQKPSTNSQQRESPNKAPGRANEAAEQVAGAIQTLKRPISPPVKEPETVQGAQSLLRINLKSLGTFPSPAKARVFYAEPYDPTDQLQSFAEAVRAHFVDAGIVDQENRNLTLHATVANIKYVKTPRGGSRGLGRRERDVDARGLAEEMKDYVWAEGIVIDRVRICKMGAVKSEDPALGMEYPAIMVPLEGGGEEVAEVRIE
jgi:activating signal cointegrator complex subunit 1